MTRKRQSVIFAATARIGYGIALALTVQIVNGLSKIISRKKVAHISEIRIIDAPCGAGKTEYIIQEMNSHHEERSYIYISPLREMFNRLDGEGKYSGRGTISKFYSPENRNREGTKLRDIKDAMEIGVDIKSTHALFLRFDTEAVEIVKSRNYELIIDEDLNAVTVLSDKNKKGSDEDLFQDLEEPLRISDLNWLLENGNIAVDKENYNQVVWVKDLKEKIHRYQDVEKMVKTGAISLINDSFVIWSFPISILDAFDKITILTYRFNNSILKAYLDFYGRKYTHMTVVRDDGGYRLADFSPDLENGSKYAGLINICDSAKLNAIGIQATARGKHPMSWGWYGDKIHREKITQLQNNLYNYLYNIIKADRDKVMWTTYKPHMKKLKPRGYVQRSTIDKRTGKPEETFVPYNCRATEHYISYNCLAYLIDWYLHPGIKSYLGQRNIQIDEDEYALSELIQWIFRSAVREGQPIDIYIPSQRMRGLLKSWLGKS